MTDHVDRLAALAIAITANLLLVAYLLQSRGAEWRQSADKPHVIELVFIEKERPKAIASAASTRPEQHAAPRPGKQAIQARRRSFQLEDASHTALQMVDLPNTPATMVGDDDWAPQQSGPKALDADFMQNPLTRRAEPMLATSDRMRLPMHDRSIGGRLQAMTRASICHDLRQALGASPASATAILASMNNNGCNKQ